MKSRFSIVAAILAMPFAIVNLDIAIGNSTAPFRRVMP
jgi:hypothetical protein